MNEWVEEGKKGRGGLVSDSSRAFLREARETPDYSLLDLVHGYVYGRWPYLYIGIGVGEHRLVGVLGPLYRLYRRLFRWWRRGDKGNGGKGFADGYHGKVLPIEQARRLVTVNEAITVRDLEQVIPYDRARSIILRNPEHIVALQCPCRTARAEPCQPLDVCLIVGEPFASFVAEHQPQRARRIGQEEAVEILQAEHERGHVHHAFFKDAMLQRFYAICNCCSCCCGAMQARRNGTPMLASSGYVSHVDQDLCIACGDCVEVCPFQALSLDDYAVVVDEESCMGCGVCASQCVEEALTLVLEPSRGPPLRVESLHV